MHIKSYLVIFALITVSAGSFLSSPALEAAVEKSLYVRLGGYGAISAVVNDFATAASNAGFLQSDPILAVAPDR